jgi:hypothetical protein
MLSARRVGVLGIVEGLLKQALGAIETTIKSVGRGSNG